MKQVLDALTSPNIAGAAKACVLLCHVITYGNTDMPMVPQNRKQVNHFFLLPYCNTDCMNIFLRELSLEYPHDYIMLIVDGAAWHRAKAIQIPDNIELFFLPPATPEMNPVEQIWAWLRLHGFRNEVFQTLDKVVSRLCDTICSLSRDTVKSISHRNWIMPTT